MDDSTFCLKLDHFHLQLLILSLLNVDNKLQFLNSFFQSMHQIKVLLNHFLQSKNFFINYRSCFFFLFTKAFLCVDRFGTPRIVLCCLNQCVLERYFGKQNSSETLHESVEQHFWVIEIHFYKILIANLMSHFFNFNFVIFKFLKPFDTVHKREVFINLFSEPDFS